MPHRNRHSSVLKKTGHIRLRIKRNIRHFIRPRLSGFGQNIMRSWSTVAGGGAYSVAPFLMITPHLPLVCTVERSHDNAHVNGWHSGYPVALLPGNGGSPVASPGTQRVRNWGAEPVLLGPLPPLTRAVRAPQPRGRCCWGPLVIYAAPAAETWGWLMTDPPPPPKGLCRPKFQPPQSEGAGRGLVPLGDQETGEQTFCCPYPPQQKWGWTESRPSTPPPPSMPSHPRTLTAGRHMVIKVPPHTDRERTPNNEYDGIWDPHGNPAGGPPLPNK